MSYRSKDTQGWRGSQKPYDRKHNDQGEYRSAHHRDVFARNVSAMDKAEPSYTSHSHLGVRETASSKAGSSFTQEEQEATFPVNPKLYERATLMATWNIEAKLGHYSLDEDYSVRWDDSGLKYFTPGNLKPRTNIFAGFDEEEYDRRQLKQDQYSSSYSISQLIDWISMNGHKLKENPNFVIKHDFMKRIILSLYDQRKSWELEAVKHKGVIYLSKLRADDNSQDSEPEAIIRMKKASYGGMNFEELSTSRMGSSQCCGRFYSVLFGRLCQAPSTSFSTTYSQKKPITVLLSAEVDAVCGNTPSAADNLQNYVEIKTVTAPKMRNKVYKFGFHKVLDMWNHCYLGGIPRIFIGMKRPYGVLEDSILTDSFSMPSIDVIHRSQQPCMDFFLGLFSWIQNTVKHEHTVYEFSFYAQNGSFVKSREVKNPLHPLLHLLK